MPSPDETGSAPAGRRLRETFVAYGATALSALAFIVSFQPYGNRSVAWIALVPFLVVLERATGRRAAVLGAAWGMIAAYGVTDWLPRSVATYYLQPVWVGATLFASAAFSMGGIYYMAFAIFYRSLARANVVGVPLLAAAAWVAAELGRGRVLTGNPWGLLGYTQSGYDAASLAGPLHYAPVELLQAASVGGVYAVSFMIVVVNVVLARVCSAVFFGRDSSKLRFDIAAAALIVSAVAAGGAWRLSSWPEDEAGASIAIVQPNLSLGSQWEESMYGANLSAHLKLTDAALTEGPLDMVIWPEAAMTFFVDQEPHYRAAIARTLSPQSVELIAGAPRFEAASVDGGFVYYNSVFSIRPNGDIGGVYDKVHLLPFAEYFPFGSIAYLKRNFGRVREFVPGAGVVPLDTVAGRAGIVVCNEAMFPRIARRRVRAGADFLVNLSNDTWVGDPKFAENQFDIAAMRAVEFGRYLIRASSSGPSGIVDPFGRVKKRSPGYESGFVRGEIGARRVETVYARVGDLFAWLCVCVVLAVSLRLWFRSDSEST